MTTELPQRGKADIAYLAGKVVVGALPVVGAPAAEILGFLFGAPVERRREQWLKDLAASVDGLRRKLGDLDARVEAQPHVVDVAIQATQAALRTSSERKREYLRNAVLNAVAAVEPDEEYQVLFIRTLDQLSELQLSLLAFFRDPRQWCTANRIQPPAGHAGSLSALLETAIPDLRDQRVLYDQLWRDLHQRGLVGTDGLHSTMSASGVLQPRLSDLGNRFMRFVSTSPIGTG